MAERGLHSAARTPEVWDDGAVSQIRVLVADDHPVVRDGLVALLGNEDDLQVVGAAANGREAIDICVETKPDVVLMDLEMPVLDGVAAIEEIGSIAPEVGVIILTNHGSDEFVFKGIEAGARGYLLKDTKSDDIAQAIRTVHEGGTVLQPGIATKLVGRFGELSRTNTASTLSSREMEVLGFISSGSTNKEIALELAVSMSTVKAHMNHILAKLGARNRSDALAEALRRKIIQI